MIRACYTCPSIDMTEEASTRNQISAHWKSQVPEGERERALLCKLNLSSLPIDFALPFLKQERQYPVAEERVRRRGLPLRVPENHHADRLRVRSGAGYQYVPAVIQVRCALNLWNVSSPSLCRIRCGRRRHIRTMQGHSDGLRTHDIYAIRPCQRQSTRSSGGRHSTHAVAALVD